MTEIPTLQPAAPAPQPAIKPLKLRRVRPGQTWFAELPGDYKLVPVVIDEVTRATVAFRLESDLSTQGNIAAAVRYARWRVVFVERVRA